MPDSAAVVALNAAVAVDCGTRTDAGTVRAGFELISVTVAPPAGAALASVTMQTLDAFAPRVVGLQTSEENTTAVVSPTVVLAELPLYAAVTVALPSLAKLAVVAAKMLVVAAAATVMEAGTERFAFVFVIVTIAPPAGAALVRVTTQLLDEFAPRLAGLQTNEETRTGATRLTVALAELLL